MKKWLLLFIPAGLITGLCAFRRAPDAAARAALGRELFFDSILSLDSTVSCASCHKPELAFADTVRFSTGVHGHAGFRNTPSVMHAGAHRAFFWDGRAASLQAQVFFPMSDTSEMGLPVATAVARLRRSPHYRYQFSEAFGGLADERSIGLALAAFERTLGAATSPADRWAGGQQGALTEREHEGRVVFLGKGQCAECHSGPGFTNGEFRSIGLFNGREWNDSGRYRQTRRKSDIGKFKVPGLRNVALTAPYMHDGSFRTLREVIDYYNAPDARIPHPLNRDTLLSRPLHLTEREKADLEAFLQALTDDAFREQPAR